MPLKFSDRLDNFRRLKGWTISELAERVGVPSERMEYLLSGKHQPGARDIVLIQKRLEIYFDPEDFENGIV